ncbi:PH domain-containing protein [Kitasatospora sp. NPDC059577]|uniref:PH domain-containing protein n=1 Tax=unclassified Kitasatospora TaxID=2633591 RepID=UPI0036ACCFCE
MEPVKSLEPARVVLVAAGALYLVIALAGVSAAPPGGKAFSAVLLVISAVWCVRMARAGLVIDRNGITARSLGRARRTPWQDVEEVAVREGRGSDGVDFWSIVLRLRDGEELLLHSTTGRDRKAVEEVGHRLLALRADGLGDGNAKRSENANGARLGVIPGDPDRMSGQPLHEPVVGPDGVPVVLRLRGPDGVRQDWTAGAVQPGGLIVGLVAAVLIGAGRLVSAVVRRVRRKPGYRLTVEVGGPEPRTLTLPFVSREQAVRHARDLEAAIGEHGAAPLLR